MPDLPARPASSPPAPGGGDADRAHRPPAPQGEHAPATAELARLRAFFDNPEVGIAITSPSKGWIEINDRLCAMLGYERDELARTTWAAITHPDDLARDVAEFERVERGEIDHYALDKRFLRKDGSVVWVLLSVCVIRRSSGEIDSFVAICADIGARKQAEEALRESEARFRRLFQGHRAVMLVLDPETGRILDANDAAVAFYGWSIDELRRMRIGDINTAPPAELSRALDSARRGERTRFQFRHRRADGSERDVDAFSNVVEIDGTPHIYSILHDVTEQRRTERERDRVEAHNRQLVKAESLGRMAAAIAHHFNNQLYVVLANLELAQMDLGDEPRGRVELRGAEDAARKAAELSGLMRTYMGRDGAARRRVDLSTVCAAALAGVTARPETAARFDLALAAPGPVVLVDDRLLDQAVVHLATNAIEALDEDPRHVRVAVGEIDGREIPAGARFPIDFEPEHRRYAWLEVEDTGRGIPARDVERLFDPFFSTKQLGRGLGLAVVLGFVRSERGAVVVERSARRGTRFRLFLPLTTAGTLDAPTPPVAQRPPAPTIDRAALRHFVELLLAGDDAGSRALVVELLDRGVGALAIGRDLFRDALDEVGVRWQRGLCDIATEHRAAAIVEGVLPLVFPPGTARAKNGRRALVACPPAERHALGARVVGHVLARRGWEVASLGPDTPVEAIVASAARARPDLVALSVKLPAHLGAALDAAAALRAAGVEAPFVLGGDGVLALAPDRLARMRDVHAMRALAELEARLPGWERG